MLEKALDKLTLNTEIVSMRHAARRARVHVINKLVREARKLRTKKGTDEQRKKYQRKADRLTEEVFIIKKLKDDNISKSALMNTEALEKVISDATVTLETRALARLANHHHLKLQVNEFRTKYPSWTETLPQLLPQLGAKRKKKDREKIKRKGVVESTEIKNNDHSDVTSNNDKENNSILEKNISRSCKVNSEKKQKQRKAPKEDSAFSQNDQDADKKEERKSQRHSGIGEVKRFTELLNEENSENGDIESDTLSESHVAVEPSKSDPFFLHADDDGSDDKDDSHDDERVQDDKERKVKKTEEDSWDKFKQMGPNRRQRRQQLFGPKPSNVGFRSFQHKPTKGFISRKNERTSALGKKEQDSTFQGNDVTVHPSWEAKRKLKEQEQAIFAFQGKKIKFDDE